MTIIETQAKFIEMLVAQGLCSSLVSCCDDHFHNSCVQFQLKEKKLITPNEPLFDEVKGGDPPRCSKVGGVSIEPRGMYDGLDKKSQKMGGNVKPPKKVRFKLEEGNPSSNSNIKHGSKEMECDM